MSAQTQLLIVSLGRWRDWRTETTATTTREHCVTVSMCHLCHVINSSILSHCVSLRCIIWCVDLTINYFKVFPWYCGIGVIPSLTSPCTVALCFPLFLLQAESSLLPRLSRRGELHLRLLLLPLQQAGPQRPAGLLGLHQQECRQSLLSGKEPFVFCYFFSFRRSEDLLEFKL